MIEELFDSHGTQNYYQLDFRRSISSQFKLLASLCQLSESAANDARIDFAHRQLLTLTMLPRSSFDDQVEALVEQAHSSLLTEQRRRIRLISVINEQNQLQTALGTNYIQIRYLLGGNSSGVFFREQFQNVMYVKNIRFRRSVRASVTI